MASLIVLTLILVVVIGAGVWFGYQAGRGDTLHVIDQWRDEADA